MSFSGGTRSIQYIDSIIYAFEPRETLIRLLKNTARIRGSQATLHRLSDDCDRLTSRYILPDVCFERNGDVLAEHLFQTRP